MNLTRRLPRMMGSGILVRYRCLPDVRIGSWSSSILTISLHRSADQCFSSFLSALFPFQSYIPLILIICMLICTREHVFNDPARTIWVEPQKDLTREHIGWVLKIQASHLIWNFGVFTISVPWSKIFNWSMFIRYNCGSIVCNSNGLLPCHEAKVLYISDNRHIKVVALLKWMTSLLEATSHSGYGDTAMAKCLTHLCCELRKIATQLI